MTLIYLLYMSWLETLGLKMFKNINTCCLLICQSCSVYRNIAHICTLTWGSKFYHLHYQFSQNSRHLLNSEVASKIQLTEVFVFRSAYIQGTWVNFLELSWQTKKNTFDMFTPFNEPIFYKFTYLFLNQ